MNDLLNIDFNSVSQWALFIWLLFDTNKKNDEREKKYQNIIENLTVKIGVIEDIKNDVEEIKDIVIRGGKNE